MAGGKPSLRNTSASRVTQRCVLAVTLVVASFASLSSVADETPASSSLPDSVRLSEAVIHQLSELATPTGIEWPYAFVASQTMRERSRALGERLFFEVRQLAAQARFETQLQRDGLVSWARVIRRSPVDGRQVGRIDPISLWRTPRLDIPLNDNDWLGQCQPDNRIQLWSAIGVRHLEWSSGLTLRQALDGLPDARSNAEHASVITLSGAIFSRGISAWNDQPYTLAPGDRIVVDLPRISAASAWVNRSLPEWLSLQWPGKGCRAVSAISGETQEVEYLTSLINVTEPAMPAVDNVSGDSTP